MGLHPSSSLSCNHHEKMESLWTCDVLWTAALLHYFPDSPERAHLDKRLAYPESLQPSLLCILQPDIFAL